MFCISVVVSRREVASVLICSFSYSQYNEEHRDLNVKEAWKQGFTGQGVVVSILDDGIEKNHPDLIQNYVSLSKHLCHKTQNKITKRFSHIHRIQMLATMLTTATQTPNLDTPNSMITGTLCIIYGHLLNRMKPSLGPLSKPSDLWAVAAQTVVICFSRLSQHCILCLGLKLLA